MDLSDLLHRNPSPAPWEEAENIPWNDPAFSARMLREHLSQRNDRASRRVFRIDRQVRWLHEEILESAPASVLDLACGPGLYTERLAALGHTCVGIDYSPAAIAYARRRGQAFGGRCRYLEADIRTASYGAAKDLCTFIHGEFNSYSPVDCGVILRRAYEALGPGGRLVLEVHTEDAVCAESNQVRTWYTAESGLFSDAPHLVLEERIWNREERVQTTRYFIVHPGSGQVEQVTSTLKSYTDTEYRRAVAAAGFRKLEFVPGLGDPEGAAADGLFAIVATR